MSKKSLLMMLLLALLVPWAAKAYNLQVQVGTGTSSSYYAPINLYYNYSYTQQIYTATQINENCNHVGDIESISFYYVGTVEKTAPITVFLKTTDKTAFSSTSDWETVTESDIVFDGDWTVTPVTGGSWITITFAEPFAYDGESNLVIAINKGYYTNYSSATTFRYTTVSGNQLLRMQNDGSAYDPYAPSTGTTSTALPNIMFNMTVAHLAPSVPTLDDVTGRTATISWTAPTTTNTVTGYAYQYSENGTDWTSGSVNGTTVTLTGLAPETGYHFQVKAVYGDGESCWTEDFEFSTLEDCPTPYNLAASNISGRSAVISWTGSSATDSYILQTGELGSSTAVNILSEGFEGGSMPEGWTRTGSYWQITSGTGYGSSYSGSATGNYNAGCYIPNYTDSDILVTPKMDLSAAVSATLNFNFWNTSWSGDINVLNVYYRVNEGSWNLLYTNGNQVSSWTAVPEITLEGLAAEYQIGFECVGNYSYGMGIDDVVIDAMVGRITWTTFDNNASNPYTMRNLEPETSYLVRVIGVCGGVEGNPSESLRFTTDVACRDLTNLTVDEITAYTAHVSWTGLDSNYDLRYAIMPTNRSEFANHPTLAELIYQIEMDYSNLQLGAAPGTQPNANTRGEQLRDGWYYYDNGTYDTNVGYGSETSFLWATLFPADSLTENLLTKVALYENSYNVNPITLFVCTGATVPEYVLYYEEFEPEGNNGFHELTLATPVAIDPTQNLWIVFAEVGTYPATTCENTGTTNAGWYSGDGSTWYSSMSYTWMVRAYLEELDMNTLDWTEVFDLNAYEYNMTNLEPETNYLTQVRTNCGDDGVTEWTSRVFKTLPTCLMPTGLTVIDSTITAHSATITWTESGSATNWQICVNDEEERPIDVTTNTYTFTDLTDQTTYTVKVRANCGGGDFSDWTNHVSFTTDIACYAPDSLMVIDSTITAFSAHLSWKSDADICDLRYAPVPENMGESWLSYDNGTPSFNIGGSSSATRTWAVMYPASMLGNNNTLSMISVFEYYASNFDSDITVRIYQGGDTIPETLLHTEVVAPVGGYDFHNIALAEAVTIDPSQNLWISLSAKGTYIMAGYACETTNPNNNWGYNSSLGWYHVSLSSGNTFGWMIRAYLGTLNWVNVPDLAENEYELTELVPNTDYIAQVRSNCDVEGYSTWASVEFTTLPSCWTPTNVVVSGVEYTQAVVDWTPNTNGTETAWQIELADDQEPPVVTIYDVTAHPDTLRGLFDDTEYTVRVRANCGEDTYSDWTEPVTFTTLSYCEAPEIDSVTNIAARTASVYWTGIQIQEKYNLRYGVEADPTIFLNVDFEDGIIPTSWINDATYAWTVVNDTVAGKKYMKSSNAGVGSSTSVIAATATYSADGFISFDALCMGEGSSTYYDHCDFYIDGTRVLYAGANISGWNNYKFAVAAGEHTFKWSYTKDSSVNPTGDYFAVDNVVMGLTTYAWEPVIENIEGTNYGLTGLTPETEYLVQVQGICPRGNTEWSEMVVFETEPSCIAPTEVVVSNIEAYQAVIDWTANSEETAWEIEVSDKSQTPPTITTWPATEHPFTLPGLFDDTDYEVRVRANCGEDDGYSDWSEPVTFTTLSHCLAPEIGEITDITATSATVNWTGHANAYDLMYAVYNSDIYLSENFENDTIVPATLTNDATYPWTIETGNGGHVMKSGNAGVSSSTSAVSVTVTYTVDGIVKFDAECRGEGTSTAYDKCIFEIDGVAQFTYGAHVTNDGWLHYSFDVAAGEHTFTWKYSKDSSVNPTGDYFAVDNIVMEYADITWAPMIANIADTTYTLTNLEPGTEYIVKVRGADCDSISWSNEVAFTTLEQTLVTQTTELAAGWNWFSTYIDASGDQGQNILNQLKECLGTNGLQIRTQGGGITYRNGRWLGSITINNVRGYQIKTSAPVTITITGTGYANPEECEITINENWNWIGYPVSESQTVTNAFADFQPNTNDQIKTSGGGATYRAGRWMPNNFTLEPGKSYLYKSSSTEQKTLVFPNVNRKAETMPATVINKTVINKTVINKKVESKPVQKAKGINKEFKSINKINNNLKIK